MNKVSGKTTNPQKQPNQEKLRMSREEFLKYLHSPRVEEMNRWLETQWEAYREMGMSTEEIEEEISIY